MVFERASVPPCAGSSPRARSPVRLRIDVEPDDPADSLRTGIWLCCAEAISNAIEHAGELAEVDIDGRCDAPEVRFEISDNGDGFATGRSTGQGFQNMSERIEQAGGALAIRSPVGVGTAVAVRIPRSHVQGSGHPAKTGSSAPRRH